MTVLREYLRRLWGALRRSPTDPDLERELRFHLEQAEEELRGRGHSPAEQRGWRACTWAVSPR